MTTRPHTGRPPDPARAARQAARRASVKAQAAEARVALEDARQLRLPLDLRTEQERREEQARVFD